MGTVDICPELVLAGVSALGAASLLAFYIAATNNGNGKRKRRRGLGEPPALDYVAPLVLAGKNHRQEEACRSLLRESGMESGSCMGTIN